MANIVAASCMLLSTGLPCILAQSAKTPALPADRRTDVYAVYSAVLAAPRLSHPDDNLRYLIFGVTGASHRLNDPAKCIRVPDGRQARFDQVLADFAKHKDDRFRLEREFSARKPYELLEDDVVQQFYKSRGMRDQDSLDGRFVGAIDLITLDNVYFDESRTLALVYMSAWCGGLCGFQSWRVFARQGAHWEEKPWARCFAIS